MKEKNFRIEHDYLGNVKVPEEAYWGAQTQRAIGNFNISEIKPPREYITQIAVVKKAAAMVNFRLGLLDKNKASAIARAADEVIAGKHLKEFVLDAYQAGAGTSTNMNVNEVIANRAIELLGSKKGDYKMVHPNDDVNKGQSTNDVIPTAMRLTMIILLNNLNKTILRMHTVLMQKAKEFDGVIKSGRTHLMDAAPVRLGQEFEAWARMVLKTEARIKVAIEKLSELNIGATAVGTGLNSDSRYRDYMVEELTKITGLKLRKAEFMPEITQSLADFLETSSVLRAIAVDLIKITNDMRLMNSGPVTGLGEISFPAVQPGSSIMPAKVNPSIAEAVCMVCFQVIGNDSAVMLSAQAGQLELNVMMPLVIINLAGSAKIMTNACSTLTEKALTGIRADRKRMAELLNKTPGVGLALNPYIGYEKAAEVVKRAIKEGESIKETAKEMKILTDKELDEIFDPYNLTSPGKPRKR